MRDSRMRRLCFTATCVEARVAVDRLVFPELLPVEIGREVRAPLHMTGGIDVNRSNPGAARLVDLTADVARNLLEVIVRVGDHSAIAFLEREQLGDDRLELGSFSSPMSPSRLPFFESVYELKFTPQPSSFARFTIGMS